MRYREFIERGKAKFLPNLSIDMVIIGYEDHQLKCLLLRFGDKWMLPGGFIGKKEAVDDAAVRILRERTGLEEPHLKFLSVFGEGQRRFREEIKEFLRASGEEWREDYWFNARYVSLVYYSLVTISKIHPVPGEFDLEVAWFSFEDLPKMWMDHESMVLEARDRLKTDISREHLTYKLLPSPFTMPDLHQLQQTILQEKLDRSRFQKKMLASGIFQRLPSLPKEAPGRNPYLYVLKAGQS